MSDLPGGWEWSTIGNVLAPLADGRTIHQGWSPQCEKHAATDPNQWGVLKTTAIQPSSFRPEHNKELPPSLDPRPAIEVEAGDILLTCAGPRARCGVACLVRTTRPRLMMSGKMYRFRVNEEHMSARYLEAYLQTASAQLDIDAIKTGGSDSGLNLTQGRFRDLRVPVAPRAEQERIVAAIEQLLSSLDAAKTTVNSASRRMETLHARVLDDVAEGTAVSLGDILREPLRNGVSAPAAADGSVRVVTLTAVTNSEFIDPNTKLIEPNGRRVDDLWMRPGDVFIERSNTPELVGTAALYEGPDRWAIFPDLLIRVRVDETRVVPSYLAYVLRSNPLRQYFQRSAQGIAGSMPKVSQPVVRAAQIPVPPVERQHEIVHRVEGELAQVQRIADELARTKRRAASLHRSILAAAFAGKLVAHDPADAPASVLLHGIRMEQAAARRRKRTRKAEAS